MDIQSKTPAKSGDEFIIAVKRETREHAPSNWIETIRATPGVRILGEGRTERPAIERRIRIEASATGIAEVRRQFADFCHIEAPVMHDFSSATAPTTAG